MRLTSRLSLAGGHESVIAPRLVFGMVGCDATKDGKGRKAGRGVVKAVHWDPAGKGDCFAYYARLRRHTPVIRAHIPTRGTGWVVTRHDDVMRVLKDSRFSADPKYSKTPPLLGFGGRFAPKLIRQMGEAMISVDDPAHGRLRRLVAKAFTPRSIDDMEPWIARLVHEMLDDLGRRGDTVDLMHDFAVPLPLLVISEMLGIPERWRMDFHHRIVRLMEVSDKPVRRALRWAPGLPLLSRFFDKLIALRRREPDGKLISRLIEANENGDHLSHDELTGMIFLLLFAGHETSVNLIGNGLVALLDHPAEMARLSADPGLMDGAVEEMLRFTNPVEYGTMRFAREDVEVAGTRIGQGEMVMALCASANRDEAAFADPDRFDIGRDTARHLAFGAGLHYCLGSALGRMETGLALRALLERFPDLRLAVPRNALRWRQASGLRGLVALPLDLGAAEAAAAG